MHARELHVYKNFSLLYLFTLQAENTGRLTTDYNDPTVVGVSFYSQYGQHDDRSDNNCYLIVLKSQFRIVYCPGLQFATPRLGDPPELKGRGDIPLLLEGKK
jgi:hypothetical protein